MCKPIDQWLPQALGKAEKKQGILMGTGVSFLDNENGSDIDCGDDLKISEYAKKITKLQALQG